MAAGQFSATWRLSGTRARQHRLFIDRRSTGPQTGITGKVGVFHDGMKVIRCRKTKHGGMECRRGLCRTKKPSTVCKLTRYLYVKAWREIRGGGCTFGDDDGDCWDATEWDATRCVARSPIYCLGAFSLGWVSRVRLIPTHSPFLATIGCN